MAMKSLVVPIAVLAAASASFAGLSAAQKRSQSGSTILMENMKASCAKMTRMHMSGNTDRDFARMMTSHHMSAISMARTEIRYGKDPELKRLAQKIVTSQGAEIKVLQSELSKMTR